jgi:valyl-tRNA synthetase
VDPLDIIHQFGADAMRYVLCEMQTGTQDIRLPVQVISPFDGSIIDLATANPGPHKGTYTDPATGQLFDMVGHMESEGVPGAKAISDRFEVGRNFCNKLWNAARFAYLNLEDTGFEPRDPGTLELEDRWILSRLTDAIDRVEKGLEVYNPSAAIGAARDFFWNELCDWYLELVKPRLKDAEKAPLCKQVLATCLDQVLRLFHPFVPFITEELWRRLGELAPRRGVRQELATGELLVAARWPEADPDWRDQELEELVAFAQEVVTRLREVRAHYQVAPSARVPIVLRAAGESADRLARCRELIANMAGAESVAIDAAAEKPKDAATTVVGDVEAYVLGVLDGEKERAKLQAQREKLAGQIAGIEKKLQNENFVAKAPAEVVDRERRRLEEIRAQLERVEASLGQL